MAHSCMCRCEGARLQRLALGYTTPAYEIGLAQSTKANASLAIGFLASPKHFLKTFVRAAVNQDCLSGDETKLFRTLATRWRRQLPESRPGSLQREQCKHGVDSSLQHIAGEPYPHGFSKTNWNY